MTKAWIILVLAGLLEVGWAVGLKSNPGFTRWLPATLTVAALIASVLLLARAMQELPLGTSYATWVGIGAVGTVVAGMLVFGEQISLLKIISVAAIVGGLVGLKIAS